MGKLSQAQLHRRIAGAVIGGLGILACIFAIVRYTSPMSEMFSWEAPFTRYELTTIVSAIMGGIFLVVGLLVFAVSFIRIGKREQGSV